jgi:hypothetical protein
MLRPLRPNPNTPAQGSRIVATPAIPVNNSKKRKRKERKKERKKDIKKSYNSRSKAKGKG